MRREGKLEKWRRGEAVADKVEGAEAAQWESFTCGEWTTSITSSHRAPSSSTSYEDTSPSRKEPSIALFAPWKWQEEGSLCWGIVPLDENTSLPKDAIQADNTLSAIPKSNKLQKFTVV